jgi:uncharacterized membrane protein
MVVMWPGGRHDVLTAGLTQDTVKAEITALSSAPCPAPQTGECTTAEAKIASGEDTGTTVPLQVGGGPLVPDLSVGDQVRLAKQPVPPPVAGAPATTSDQPAYALSDFERGRPMLWLAIMFCALVLVFGRLRGALSLLGLLASLLVVLFFIVPAILDGTSPLAVSLCGSLAVMLLTISLAHGLGPKSVAAMLGTTLSLALVALLAVLFVDLTHLTGLAGDDTALVQLGAATISFKGLLLAGMLIGALGVLDDVTVSQASTVMALRSANPGLGLRELYNRAMDVGRDHVSATVNTLVLAYVGSSLPVLLIFGSGGIGFFDAVNVELVAQEIVATLVGSIGLIAAVPITTALAATLSSYVSTDELAAEPLHQH